MNKKNTAKQKVDISGMDKKMLSIARIEVEIILTRLGNVQTNFWRRLTTKKA